MITAVPTTTSTLSGRTTTLRVPPMTTVPPTGTATEVQTDDGATARVTAGVASFRFPFGVVGYLSILMTVFIALTLF